MKKLTFSFFFLIFIFSLFAFVTTINAAEIKTGDDSVIIVRPMKNAYVFGGSVDINAPITNDLTTVGGDITINSPVTGDILAAGGNITVSEKVGDSIRIAGGDIMIDAPVENDVVIVGGSVKITQNASIKGDLIFIGGKLSLQGTVNGDAHINGGSVIINNRVGGNVSGTVGSLTLGPFASIGGDLIYSSSEKAKIDAQARIQGKTQFTELKEKSGIRALISTGVIYKLIADILFALLFILFLPLFTKNVLHRAGASALKNIVLGFVNLLLMPIASFILLIIFWLGATSFVIYILLILLSLGLTKVYVGWKTLSWWYSRNKKDYILDWKAAIVGVIVLFIVGLIPVFGWLAGFLLFLLTLGSIAIQLTSYLSTQQQKVASSRKLRV